MADTFCPRPYQVRATAFILEKKRGNLWLDPGLGKTTIALNVADILLLTGDVQQVLILAPARVAHLVWEQEAKKWSHLAHLEFSLVLGSAAERKAALRDPAPIKVMNYENVNWLLKELGAAWPFDLVVADEATSLKNPASVRFRGKPKRTEKNKAGEIVTLPAEMGLKHVAAKATFWINLTGTPAPNGIEDLWSQNFLIDQGERLGRNVTAFRERWFRQGYVPHTYEALPHAHNEVMSLLKDVTLTLKAEDYLDLPPVIENIVPVDISAKHKAYKAFEKSFVMELKDGVVTAANAAVMTSKLRQFTAGAMYQQDMQGEWELLHDARLDALSGLLDELGGQPVIVFYHYNFEREMLLSKFPEARVLDDKKQTEDDWNAGKIKVLLAQPASVAHGLSLQHGGNVHIWYTLDFDLERFDQANERNGPTRQKQSGYDRPVFRHYLVAAGTIDEVCLKVLRDKAKVQDALKEYMKAR